MQRRNLDIGVSAKGIWSCDFRAELLPMSEGLLKYTEAVPHFIHLIGAECNLINSWPKTERLLTPAQLKLLSCTLYDAMSLRQAKARSRLMLAVYGVVPEPPRAV